jgi:hypothetical protein
MPAGYSSRCKTCNSPHRLDIEAWHEEGLSDRAIEARLESEFGEKISHVSLWNHFLEHYDVQSEVREQYYQSQLNLENEAQERVSEIQILDDVVQGKYRLHQRLDRLIGNRLAGLEDGPPIELPKLPLSYVSLYTGCASEIRQTLKQKQEMLGEDPTSKEAATWTELIASVHSRRRSALRPGPE